MPGTGLDIRDTGIKSFFQGFAPLGINLPPLHALSTPGTRYWRQRRHCLSVWSGDHRIDQGWHYWDYLTEWERATLFPHPGTGHDSGSHAPVHSTPCITGMLSMPALTVFLEHKTFRLKSVQMWAEVAGSQWVCSWLSQRDSEKCQPARTMLLWGREQ